MRSLFGLFLILIAVSCQAMPADSLQEQLRMEIAGRSKYDQQREKELHRLKLQLARLPAAELDKQFNLSLKIYNAYKSYQYDSAYVYATRLQELSIRLKSTSRLNYSRIKLGFIFLSSGMFKETFDKLEGINVHDMDDSIKVEYYSLMTRANYDLAEYDNDLYFQPIYKALANKYIDSAISLSPENSYNKLYLTGYKAFKNGYVKESAGYFKRLLSSHTLTDHQTAIVASTLSNSYLDPGQQQQRLTLLTISSIADIRSSTKETIAMFWLSELLYKMGENEKSYAFLQVALGDAQFYGARQRKITIGALLPLVAAARFQDIETEKSRVWSYMGVITGIALLIVLFSVALFRQLRKLQAKESVIDDKNRQLEQFNEQLMEGTRIKEEYIGNFFNLISDYIGQLESLKRTVGNKLLSKKYEDIQLVIDKIYIKKEREKLFHTFDTVFIRIFPNFIESFNALFKKEDQSWPREEEVLTTDLRIYALIRLGITDIDTIARFLEYSEKTIYVYKMRIKAKAINPGDHFEQQIMAIKAAYQPAK